jgi:hypothetical protein
VVVFNQKAKEKSVPDSETTGAITFSGANKVSGPNVSLSGTDFSFAFWLN